MSIRRMIVALVSVCTMPLAEVVPQMENIAIAATEPGFRKPDPKTHPGLFVWTDTCNVHDLRNGDAALLIDLGDGSVLDHLAEIGVKRVEWVLLTHHHREQCQGIERVDQTVTKVAAPKAEQALFETPTEFRKWFPTTTNTYSTLTGFRRIPTAWTSARSACSR